MVIRLSSTGKSKRTYLPTTRKKVKKTHQNAKFRFTQTLTSVTDRSSLLKYKVVGNRVIEIFGENGQYREVGKLITKVKNIARENNIRKIIAKVTTDENEINEYFKRDFNREIRFDKNSGRIELVHRVNYPKLTQEQKEKAEMKIKAILLSLNTDGYVMVQVTIDPKLSEKFKSSITSNTVEWGGTMKLTKKKFRPTNGKYEFIASEGSVSQGSFENFSCYPPLPNEDRREFISFHTHPDHGYAKYGFCLAPPSPADLNVVTARCIYLNESGHLVITHEGPYLMELDKRIRGLGKFMSYDDKTKLVQKIEDFVNREFSNLYDNRLILNQRFKNEIARVGATFRTSGHAQRTKYLLNYRGVTTETSNAFKFLNDLRSKGIPFSLSGRHTREQRKMTMSKFLHALRTLTINNIGLPESLKIKYNIPYEIRDIPIIHVNNIFTNRILRGEGGGLVFPHNYSTDFTFYLNKDISQMKKALKKSSSFGR